MGPDGVRRLTCEKDHSHWREVSVQNDAAERELKSAARCILKVCQLDPEQGYGSRGLHRAPTELRDGFNVLYRYTQWRHSCRR